MATITTDNKHYTNIANRIRNWVRLISSNPIKTYTPEEMADGIDEVFHTGEAVGYDSGYREGEADASFSSYQSGYADGKSAEYNKFWDSYQQNGVRNHYAGAFYGYGWTKETFAPKHNMDVQDGIMMFRHFCATEEEPMDLVSVLKECGVTLDFTKAYSMDYTFQNAKISKIGVVNLSRKPTLSYTFASSSIEEIEKMVVLETQTYPNTFSGCTNLKNILFEGVIGNDINFSTSSNLTYDSLMHDSNEGVYGIICALKDYSGTTTTKILTLHANAKARLTEYEIAVATQKGWTVA